MDFSLRPPLFVPVGTDQEGVGVNLVFVWTLDIFDLIFMDTNISHYIPYVKHNMIIFMPTFCPPIPPNPLIFNNPSIRKIKLPLKDKPPRAGSSLKTKADLAVLAALNGYGRHLLNSKRSLCCA